jgi:hypothetical protein
VAKRASGKTLSRPLSEEEVAKFAAATEETNRARAVLDRTLAQQLGIRREQQHVKAPSGRPPEYDIPAIDRIANDWITSNRIDDHLSWTIDKIREALVTARVKVPGATRLREIVKPIYDRAKAKRDEARASLSR